MDSSVNAPDLELPDDEASAKIKAKQDAWSKKLFKSRGGAAWRLRKMHRLAARNVARMVDSQLRTTIGMCLDRFRKKRNSKAWSNWSRPLHSFDWMCFHVRHIGVNGFDCVL